VGSYPLGATPKGVLDIAGNMWEWCYDWYGSYELSPDENHSEPNNGDYRVLRGGSWNYDFRDYFRCASRNHCRPGSRDNNLGFRIART